jgi:hypothetical protein
MIITAACRRFEEPVVEPPELLGHSRRWSRTALRRAHPPAVPAWRVNRFDAMTLSGHRLTPGRCDFAPTCLVRCVRAAANNERDTDIVACTSELRMSEAVS